MNLDTITNSVFKSPLVPNPPGVQKIFQCLRFDLQALLKADYHRVLFGKIEAPPGL